MKLPREIQTMILEQMIAEHFDGDGLQIFWSGGPQNIYRLISTDPAKISAIKVLDDALLYSTLFPSQTSAVRTKDQICFKMCGRTETVYFGKDLFLKELALLVEKEIEYYHQSFSFYIENYPLE